MNKDLINQMQCFLKDLLTDEKTIIINNGLDYIYLITMKEEIFEAYGHKITKEDIFEHLRKKFLSILFIKNNRKKFDTYIDLWYDIEEVIGSSAKLGHANLWKDAKKILPNDILDTNNIYLYSDTMAKAFGNYLIDINEPVSTLIEVVYNANKIDRLFLLLILFSLIRKEGYEDGKLEQIKEITNMLKLMEFLVNSNFEKEYFLIEEKKEFGYDIKLTLIKQIQYFQNDLRKGYLNEKSLNYILN